MHGVAICQNIHEHVGCQIGEERSRGCVNFSGRSKRVKQAQESIASRWLSPAWQILQLQFSTEESFSTSLAPTLASPTTAVLFLLLLPPCLWKKVVALLPHREYYYYDGRQLLLHYSALIWQSCWLMLLPALQKKLFITTKMALLWQRLYVGDTLSVMDKISKVGYYCHMFWHRSHYFIFLTHYQYMIN